MAGNLRCELTSASPEDSSFMGSHHAGHKGKHFSTTLDRSGSFREGNDSRVSSSGGSTPRASTSSVGDLPPLSQYLLLDPIPIGDQNYSRSGELRRAFGIAIGSEDNAFGAAYSKLPAPVATDELRRVRGSIHDSFMKARSRIKRLNESLVRLNKYSETLYLKKLQRNELINERSGSPNFLKIRNPSDVGTQRVEDRTKNISKRVRSSVVDLRADSRSNTLARQSLVTAKERDGGEAFDVAEEKFPVLPAVGDSWEKKMKRKRSVGSVFTRSMDMEGDVKRVAQESGVPSFDSQGLGSGTFNGAGNSNKLDRISSPVGSIARVITKNEQEKVFTMKDVASGTNKERFTTKANNKLNLVEDGHMVCRSPVTKGKASRAPRTGSGIAGNMSSFPRTSGGVEGWEQTLSVNKVNSAGALNNRKRSMTARSSSPMQWATQRPQKTSRNRRANVVSPISNNDELQLSSEGGPSTDVPSRGTTGGSNGSLLPKYLTNGSQQARIRHENVSPARLSESEESVAVENGDGRSKERGHGSGEVGERSSRLNVGPSVLLKKKKMLTKEDIVDGVRRQGRTGRGASSARATIELMKVKTENLTPIKPHRSSRPAPEKNGSKSGRPPLKKNSDRKAVARLGQLPIGNSPDFTGESDDDREELLAAAAAACNASYNSSSSTFWKNVEPLFDRICLDDSCYLNHQLRSAVETNESLSEVQGHFEDSLEDLVHGEFQSHFDFEENRSRSQDHVHSVNLGNTLDYVDQGKDDGNLGRSLKDRNKIASLYQRVLSALIVEDEFEEVDGEGDISSQLFRESSPDDSRPPVVYDLRNGNEPELDSITMLSFQAHKLSYIDEYACNGVTNTTDSVMGTPNQLCNGDMFKESYQFVHMKSGIDDAQPAALMSNHEDCRYVQMYFEEKLWMELQSIGLNPESVPDLADGEGQLINQDIEKLQSYHHQQVTKKKVYLTRFLDEIGQRKETEERDVEQVAMDKLVEFAYKKLLATKGSYASKNRVPKVSRHAAISFIKRTLNRCRKLEDTGKSCFSEPELRDILFATPSRGNDLQSSATAATENMHPGTPNSQQESGSFMNGKFNMSGPDVCGTLKRVKKKEVLLDEVGGNASSIATTSLGNMLQGGAKGKRSERDRDKGTLGRNGVNKGGRGSTKGDRKVKSKPRQRTAQLSMSGDGNVNKLKETNTDRKEEVELMPHDSNAQPPSKESKEMSGNPELQELENFELGDGNQDLTTWFNFEVDGLLPENDLAGLDIPMDDLSDLNMLL